MLEILDGKFVLKPGAVLYVDEKSDKEGTRRVVECDSINIHGEEAIVVLRCYFPGLENDETSWRDDFEIEVCVKKGQETKTFMGPIISFDGERVRWRLMESSDGGRGVLGASIC